MWKLFVLNIFLFSTQVYNRKFVQQSTIIAAKGIYQEQQNNFEKCAPQIIKNNRLNLT